MQRPEECSSYEKYDSDSQTCYFECMNESECLDIQQSIDKELSELYSILENNKIPNHSTYKEKSDLLQT